MNLDYENQCLEKAIVSALEEQSKMTIGVQSEHTLHRVLKFYLSDNLQNHEVLINKMYADVVIDQHIYEVQTKNFNLLRNKLERFLPDYDVTIVYPIALNKMIYLFNDNGEIIKEFKSPKHSKLFDVMLELYKIKTFLTNKHLHLKIIILDLDEHRLEKAKTYRSRKGFERINQIPRKIHQVYDFQSLLDFKNELLKYDLPTQFDSKLFSKKCRINIKGARIALNVLAYLEVVEIVGKKGNSYIYQIKLK